MSELARAKFLGLESKRPPAGSPLESYFRAHLRCSPPCSQGELLGIKAQPLVCLETKVKQILRTAELSKLLRTSCRTSYWLLLWSCPLLNSLPR